MNLPRLPVVIRPARHHAALTDPPPWELAPFTTADQVLLSCFGLDQVGQRSREQLREALVEAGFSPPSARAVVRASPLIHRTLDGSYRLRNPEPNGQSTTSLMSGHS